jgi:hypothetical protein
MLFLFYFFIIFHILFGESRYLHTFNNRKFQSTFCYATEIYLLDDSQERRQVINQWLRGVHVIIILLK